MNISFNFSILKDFSSGSVWELCLLSLMILIALFCNFMSLCILKLHSNMLLLKCGEISELYMILRVFSEESIFSQDKEREIKHSKKVLSVAETPSGLGRAKGHVTLIYIAAVTEPIFRLIRKAGVAAHAKPHNTISSILLAPKGPSPGRCGVVNQLTCHDCEASDIG